MAHIIVIDDEQTILDAIQAVLEDAGHNVTTTQSGETALRYLAEKHFDLCILDIIMPEIGGIELCRRIRANSFIARIPIIFLTAKSRPHDIATGLDAGGDDYLTKPFEIVELPARVRALLRRSAGGSLDPNSEFLAVNGMRLAHTEPVAFIGEHRIALTTLEHQLLHYLMSNAGKPVSADRLLEDIWQYPPGTGNHNTLQVHIANLRSKLSEYGGETLIRSVRGQGYMIG